MKILSADQVKNLDAVTIQHQHIPSVDLMERASRVFTEWFVSRYSSERRVIIICGPGNNGGDGLAVARLLHSKKYLVEVYAFEDGKKTEEFVINEKRLEGKIKIAKINASNLPVLEDDAVVIDAIFGTGLNRKVEGVFASVINLINNSSLEVVSIDIASGLFADTYNNDSVIVNPKVTATFQLPKFSFFLPQNEKYVGAFEILDIGLDNDFIENARSDYFYFTYADVKALVKQRKKFSHKGTYGKALLMAGSYGMMGAAVLAARACYRSGTGLVKVYVPACGYEIIQAAVPEAITASDPAQKHFTELPDLKGYDSIGAGPGWNEGSESSAVLLQLLRTSDKPLVLDAGALNIIAREKWLGEIPEGSVLTPHPGEFNRLAGPFDNDYQRLSKLRSLATTHKLVIVLKGAHTAVAMPDGRVLFNSSGNPGMATAGSGDVLTGIIAGLLAQKYPPEQAALLGVYMHGFAGDVAAEKLGYESLIASDIIDNIFRFFRFSH
ncbi:MAG: NAD(P)H-hydrate dehydratase [Cytophagaceae bacterium]